jgi:serine protease AprX
MKKVLLLTLICAVALSAMGDDSKLAPELRGYNSQQKVQVIVQYKQMPKPSLLGGLLNVVGNLLSQIPLLNAVVSLVDSTGLVQLANDPNVVYVSPDRPLSLLSDNAAPVINAKAAWNAGYTGNGVGVAVIDSGVDSAVDLGSGGLLNLSRVVYNENFVPGKWSASDEYGHGTHVAGLIAGNGASSTGASYFQTFKGVAPSARIINLRVLDENGVGTDSQVIAAINRAIQLKSLYNIRVINLSLGRPVVESYKLDPLCKAAEAAWKAGIVVVVAGGNNGRDNSFDNNGYGTITAPGNDPYVLTVGAMKGMGTATRADDQIASYSSKGPTAVDHLVKPDLVAPGNLLVSLSGSGTLAAEYPANKVPKSIYTYGGSSAAGPYFILSGTSMAAGVVSGAVADVLQQHSSLTPDQVKARLMKTASKTFPKSTSTTDPDTGLTK